MFEKILVAFYETLGEMTPEIDSVSSKLLKTVALLSLKFVSLITRYCAKRFLTVSHTIFVTKYTERKHRETLCNIE